MKPADRQRIVAMDVDTFAKWCDNRRLTMVVLSFPETNNIGYGLD